MVHKPMIVKILVIMIKKAPHGGNAVLVLNFTVKDYNLPKIHW